MRILENIMVPMRDGVLLATDIYLPDIEDKKYPVVIERTPYGKHLHSRSEVTATGKKVSRLEMAEAFVAKGIAVVYQDVRGRYASEGKFIKYLNEAKDGFDTLEWISKQTWCDGNIGSMGLSYCAHTQLSMACLHPTALKTMILDSGGFANSYHCGIRQGGAFELKQATWAYKQAKNSSVVRNDPVLCAALDMEDIKAWFHKMPWIEGHSPLRHVPEYESYLFDQWRKGKWDDEWQNPGICADGYYEQIPNIPILHVSSWYDNYVWSTLHNYSELKKCKTSPQSLIMGPWLHGDRNIAHSGDADFGQAALFDGNLGKSWLDVRVEWMEKHLIKKEHCDPSVKIFMMGGGSGTKTKDERLDCGGHWIVDKQWPLSQTKETVFYLHQNKTLQLTPTSTGIARFYSDPLHPIPTIGGSLTSGKPVYEGGGFNQIESSNFFGTDGSGQPLTSRQDILSFQTDILTEDLLLAGDVYLHIAFETDVPDCDITVKLVDVYPPNESYPQGYALNLTDGIMRARYRNSWSNPQEIKPGELVELDVYPFATCCMIKKGHRLRLDIAGSNFPHFDVNPNSFEPEGEARHPRVAHHTVHLDKCYLVLQLLIK